MLTGEIRIQNFKISLNRYKQVVHTEVAHRPPGKILNAPGQLEVEIQRGTKELDEMLKCFLAVFLA